jgi:predicted nucleic acid-binding Zn ribbon protein
MLPITQTSKLALGLLVVMAMALAGCLLTPGRFTSALDVRKDGRFSFAYTGEIHLLALSKLAESAADNGTFSPSTCYKDDDGSERKCTAAEIKQQKSDWETQRAAGAEKRRQDAESMKAMLGGIDPANPKAGEEFAARLRRQTGWKSVVYKGDGLFVVDFALSGRLDHDFTFPTIERFPLMMPFVQIVRRSDGAVRVDAPGYGPAQSGEPFRGMAGAFAAKPAEGESTPGMPVIDGTFTLRTDAGILANNTDEGPQADPAGQRLDWAVNVRSQGAPTALLKLN